MLVKKDSLKYKKFHKLFIKKNNFEQKLFCPKFSNYGLQSRSVGIITAKQLEAGRLVVSRFSKKKAFLKINVFPNLPLSKKSTSSRMGKGKGKIFLWVAPIKIGKVIFEISSIRGKFNFFSIFKALKLINYKMPVLTKQIVLIY